MARQEENPIVRPAEPSGQITQVLSQTQDQGRVENIQGPFVPEQGAVVEEVHAVEGFELPAGQVPQGLMNPSVEVRVTSTNTSSALFARHVLGRIPFRSVARVPRHGRGVKTRHVLVGKVPTREDAQTRTLP